MVDGHHVDTHIIDKLVDEVFNDNYVSTEDSVDDILNENHQNVEVEAQSKRSVEVEQDDEDDDVLIANSFHAWYRKIQLSYLV